MVGHKETSDDPPAQNDPNTGTATMIDPTGMPPDPHFRFTVNPDGTVNLCVKFFMG